MKELQNASEPSSSKSLPEEFYTPHGYLIKPVDYRTWKNLIKEAISDYGFKTSQMIEASGLAGFLVIRYALGTTAEGGIVTILASPSLNGIVALTTAKKLIHGGSHCRIGILDTHHKQNKTSYSFNQCIDRLKALGVECYYFSDPIKDQIWLQESLDISHHVLYGGNENKLELSEKLVVSLNEEICPVHVIGITQGINCDTGQLLSNTVLVASSTLSLGIPYSGLQASDLLRNETYCGRLYVADIGIFTRVPDKSGELHPLFADQPIQTLLRNYPEHCN
jgi:NAD(P)H-hydrate repair Nnr-like enzyme with NAD(P)H-hydrate epimerase domain